MKPHRTVIGAAALSLAVAGSLAGAGSASADSHDVVCGKCEESSPRVAALHSVLIKLDELMLKFESPLWKFETPLQKVHLVLEKWHPTD